MVLVLVLVAFVAISDATSYGSGKPGSPNDQLEEERVCNSFPCTPEQPGDYLVKYSEWTECNQLCGGGVERRCGCKVVDPQYGCAPCPTLEEERSCNTQLNCVPELIDGILKYTDWIPCSKLFGRSTRRRWGEVLHQLEETEKPKGLSSGLALFWMKFSPWRRSSMLSFLGWWYLLFMVWAAFLDQGTCQTEVVIDEPPGIAGPGLQGQQESIGGKPVRSARGLQDDINNIRSAVG